MGSCETCGRTTIMDCVCCGVCAADSNDPNQQAGRARIAKRRQIFGLPPLDRKEDSS